MVLVKIFEEWVSYELKIKHQFEELTMNKNLNRRTDSLTHLDFLDLAQFNRVDLFGVRRWQAWSGGGARGGLMLLLVCAQLYGLSNQMDYTVLWK